LLIVRHVSCFVTPNNEQYRDNLVKSSASTGISEGSISSISFDTGLNKLVIGIQRRSGGYFDNAKYNAANVTIYVDIDSRLITA